MTPDRVAVTGAGALCPIASDLPSFERELEHGGSRARRIEADLAPRLTLHQSRRLDRLAQILLIAGGEAAAAARLSEVESGRLALVVGTGLGCLEKSESQLLGIAREGVRHLDPLGFPESMDNAPAAHAAIALGCRAGTFTVREREISGESAILVALSLLHAGSADAVMVLAGDSPGPLAVRAIARVAPRAHPGEGAGAVVLETEASARRRGARVRGRIAGWARCGGPVSPFPRRPSPDLIARTEARAWSMAGSAERRGRRIASDALRDRIGWCPGDGVLRMLAGVFLLERAEEGPVLVSGTARNGAVAAVVLASAGSS